jgi:dTDP-4-dehydrorhamnose reductase
MLSQAMAGGAGWWQENGGIYHLGSRGSTSWHGFAEAIMAAAAIPCEVQAISSSEYPGRVRRPSNSTLCCDKLAARFFSLPEWREALRLCMDEMQTNIE